MKRSLHSRVLLSSFIAISLLFFLSSLQQDPVERATHIYQQNFNELLNQVVDLKTLIDVEGKDIDALKKSFFAARLAYKKVEFLMEYYDAGFVKKQVNGANLYWLDESLPKIEEQAPHGFQVIEELLFAEEQPLWRDAANEVRLLVKKLDSYNTMNSKRAVYGYHIWEAIRIELVRIYTLGITGFDSPVLANSIVEAKAALESLKAASRLFSSSNNGDAELHNQLQDLFDQTIEYLDKNNDFDSFDRLHFYKAHIQPLLEQTLIVQKSLGLYISKEYQALPGALNYNSTQVFEDGFLDPTFYSKFKANSQPHVVTLGKMLFFDPILSSNNKRACASCHDPEKAFTDGKAKSLAFDFQGAVDRNSPTLINSVFSDKYFHDLRAFNIEDQTEHVLLSPKEFATTYKEVLEKLRSSSEYKQLFDIAFGMGDASINRNTTAYALSEFVRSLRGFNSPFDRYMRGEIEGIDESVKRGYNLFTGKAACATCHFVPVFNGTVPPAYSESESEVIGVPINADLKNPLADNDLGRYGVTRQNASIFHRSFKTPTVRNVALTAPYMHNGVFNTLDEVVEFYNEGGGAGLGMSFPNQTLPADKLNLNKKEMKDLIRFMEALTDTSGLTGRPKKLPAFEDSVLNERVVGGEY